MIWSWKDRRMSINVVGAITLIALFFILLIRTGNTRQKEIDERNVWKLYAREEVKWTNNTKKR